MNADTSYVVIVAADSWLCQAMLCTTSLTEALWAVRALELAAPNLSTAIRNSNSEILRVEGGRWRVPQAHDAEAAA